MIINLLTVTLNVDLNSRFRPSLLQRREQIRDIIPWVSVQPSAQSLLVQVVRNQTNAAAQNEEPIQHTVPHVVLNLLGRESAAVAHEVNKADRNAAVHVENEVVLLGSRHRLNGNRIFQQLCVGEVLLGELLDQLDTQIGVVARLDPVPDTRDYSVSVI